jgi:predicted O-linked N-acetylglucosamine transferase (SPINDLY family)
MASSPRSSGLVQATFAEALRHHQAGRLQDAERLYRQVLAIDGRHADSLHLLGVVAYQSGRSESAVELIGRALKLAKDVPFYHSNLGNALRACGRLDEAAREYRRALHLKPDYAEAHNNLGSVLKAQGKLDLAAAQFERALKLLPDYADAHNNFGHTLYLLGRLEEAIRQYERALALKPDLAPAHGNLGHALTASGRLDEAAAAFERALALAPDYAIAHADLANVLKARGKLDEAASRYERATALKPEYAEAHNNLGSVRQDQGRLEEAVACYERAIAARPDLAQAHYNLGTVRRHQGRLDEAASCFEIALACDPGYVLAACDLAGLRLALGDFAGARALYNRAIETRPHDPLPYRYLLASLLYDPALDADAVFAEHRRFAASPAVPRGADVLPPGANVREPERKLRVGWLTADVRDHPVMKNLVPIFGHRDRDRFEDIFYAEPAQSNDVQAGLRQVAAGWRPTVGLTDAQVAALIRSDGVDILMVLAGHFDRNRPQVAAFRPAPIQMSIFDPATSGLAAMDYLVIDAAMAPKHGRERFSERPLRLPNVYLHPRPDEAPAPAPPPVLATGTVRFGCFNNPAKLNDRVLELWARVLERVPGSRLVLRYFNQFQAGPLRERVLAAMGSHGIEAARIDWGGTDTSAAGHLAQYATVDVALDPFPFTGSTTTFEALWMGVPVVSLIGHSVVSRWTYAMLRQVGLGELGAATPDAYVEIAARLAADRERLTQLRSSLRATVSASALCDARRTTRHLERAQRAVWRRWCRS